MNRGICTAGGLVAVLSVLALAPANTSILPAQADSPFIYGMAELVHKNGDGDIVAFKTVHNRLLDTGEDVLIKGLFGAHAANEAPRLICITDSVSVPITLNAEVPAEEALAAADFEPTSGFASSDDITCVMADIDTANDTSVAVMTAAFNGSDASPSHVAAGRTFEYIVVCSQTTSTTAFTDCGAAGEAFSAVNIGSTTVNAADSVEVTYRFDLTTPDT